MCVETFGTPCSVQEKCTSACSCPWTARLILHKRVHFKRPAFASYIRYLGSCRVAAGFVSLWKCTSLRMFLVPSRQNPFLLRTESGRSSLTIHWIRAEIFSRLAWVVCFCCRMMLSFFLLLFSKSTSCCLILLWSIIIREIHQDRCLCVVCSLIQHHWLGGL